MQTRSEAEQAEQIARQLRAVRAAVEQSQQRPSAHSQLRQELRGQLEALEEQRDEIAGQLQNPMVSGSNRTGLSKRIEQLDGRIAAVDQQIAAVDAAIARASGIPGVRVPPLGERRSGPSSDAFMAIGMMFILCAILPLSIAYARRIWRRGAAAVTPIPREIGDRLARMDQNLDAIALEVERVGEAQRYLTRMYAEQQGLPGPAEVVQTPERHKEWQRKGS